MGGKGKSFKDEKCGGCINYLIFIKKCVVQGICTLASAYKFIIWPNKKQFCPSREDIKNKKIEELAKRLKGKSDKETLTNILDWQEKNIQYWPERSLLDISSWFLLLIGIGLYSITFLPLLLFFIIFFQSLSINDALVTLIPVIIFCLVVLFVIYQNRLTSLLYFILFSYPVYQIIRISFPIFLKNKSVGWIIALLFSWNGALSGAAATIVLYLILRYRPLFRKIPLKEKIPKIWTIMQDTFKESLSVNKILEYKLGICRDYAKLTAALLLNLYPKAKIYFFSFSGHVACGIKIEERFYILDQKLPLYTERTWLKLWKELKNVNKANIYSVKLTKNNEIKFIYEGQIKTPSQKFQKVNIRKLEKTIAKTLELKESVKERTFPKTKILLKNFLIEYEESEVVKYSTLRMIKNKVENEFCGNMNNVVGIKIKQCKNKKDLMLVVYYTPHRK